MRIELLYVLGLLSLNFIMYLTVYYTGFYGSEVLFKEVANKTILINYFYILTIGYLVLYYFYINITKIKISSHIKIHTKSMGYIYLIILAINYILFLATGIGKAGTSTSEVGFITNMLPINFIFLIYYIQIKKYTWLEKTNLAMSLIFILLKGWSGPLIILIIIEFFYRNQYLSLRKFFKLILFILLTLIGYYFIYILKYYIRDGIMYDVNFFVVVEYAIGRLVAFTNFAFFMDIIEQFAPIVSSLKGDFYYISDFILGVIPKALVGISNFTPIDNLYTINFISPKLENSGFAITLPGQYLLSIKLNALNIVLFPLFVSTLFLIIYLLLRMNWNRKVQIYFFIFMMGIFFSGNMKEISLTLYSIIFFLIINLLLNSYLKMRN